MALHERTPFNALLPREARENPDSEVARQLHVEWSEPRHTVYVRYPVPTLLDGELGEELMTIVPADVVDKWPFEELVQEASIIEKTSKFNQSDSSFFVTNEVKPAETKIQNDGEVPQDGSSLGVDDGLLRLIRNVRACPTGGGRTVLKVVTFQTDDYLLGPGEFIIRVKRSTKGLTSDGTSFKTKGFYDFHPSKVEPELQKYPFLDMMTHVLSRESMRAQRHVQFWLDYYGSEDTEYDEATKGSRVVCFSSEPLLAPLNDEELLEEDKECSICKGDYTPDPQAAHRATQLRRCSHVFGYECIRKWCEKESALENGVQKLPLCPYRCQILDPIAISVAQRRLRNGTYYDLPQFSAFENAEIACADLDAQDDVARVANKEIVICGEVMEHAILHFVGNALLEDAGETPYYLQPVRFAETQAAIACVRSFVNTFSGCCLSYSLLCEYLKLDIAAELLLSTYMEGQSQYWDPFFKVPDKTSVRWWAYAEAAPVRLGTYSFVNLLIHRMLYFQKLRSCTCSPGFHKHGARSYYNPRNFPVDPKPAEEAHEYIREFAGTERRRTMTRDNVRRRGPQEAPLLS